MLRYYNIPLLKYCNIRVFKYNTIQELDNPILDNNFKLFTTRTTAV